MTYNNSITWEENFKIEFKKYTEIAIALQVKNPEQTVRRILKMRPRPRSIMLLVRRAPKIKTPQDTTKKRYYYGSFKGNSFKVMCTSKYVPTCLGVFISDSPNNNVCIKCKTAAK